jgi:NAD(P)-dependent dehydrogenase (short-subunit alcohol dehydrogenase family)
MSKTILVTGANRGIGFGLVEQFAKSGHTVLAGFRPGADLTALKRLDQEYNIRLYPLSQTEPETVDKAVRLLNASGLSLDILVNNAATFPETGTGSLPDIELESLVEAFQVNVVGVLRVTRAFLPALRESRAEGGAVVAHISSGVASLSQRDMGGLNYAYSISKSALNKAVRTVSRDPAFEGIAQVLFNPGWVRTDMGGDNAELSLAESAEPLAASILRLGWEHNGQWLDRFGKPSEFAW